MVHLPSRMGTLYVVATPIGNLEDITLRALRVLREVALVAAEDTRHTAGLLRRYDIRTPTTSFHEHNERRKIPLLIDKIAAGNSLALVSDAGTPGIADPGYRLVRAALDAGLPVQAVPGPSAVLGALISSGFPTDSFTFLGFPPRKPAARDAWLAGLSAEPRTVVFFEAPHRLRQTLGVMAKILGARPICLTKELTKVFESTFVGTSSAALNMLNDPKGEYAVVVSPPTSDKASNGEPPSDREVGEFIGRLTERDRISKRQGISMAAQHFGIASRAVYSALERTKKQRNSVES